MEPEASATSSRVVVEKEERPIGTLYSVQARAVANSPSEWARRCMAVGATPSGMEEVVPKRDTDVSILETSRRTRGRMRYLVKAERFSASVLPESAP